MGDSLPSVQRHVNTSAMAEFEEQKAIDLAGQSQVWETPTTLLLPLQTHRVSISGLGRRYRMKNTGVMDQWPGYTTER